MRSILVLALAACHAAVPAPPSTTIGVHRLTATDPLTHAPLPIALFYPATGSAGVTDIGPYHLAAASDAPIVATHHALIVLSHGHGGSLWDEHDLAEALATAGYVVVTVEHIGDSHSDPSAFGTDRALLGRAYQVSAAIDTVLADPTYGPRIDRARIGIAGFSAGGWTSLLVVGARPDFARWPMYCKRHPEDTEMCSFPFTQSLKDPRPTVDPRVHAAFAMAPFALALGPDSFHDIKQPVFLAYAAEDRVLIPSENAEAIAPAIPTLTGTRKLEGVGHYIFMAPCSAELATYIPDICATPAGIDRVALHRELAADAIKFFDASLR